MPCSVILTADEAPPPHRRRWDVNAPRQPRQPVLQTQVEMSHVIVDHLQSLEEYNAWCGISPRYGGLLSRRLPGEDPPDRLEPDAFLERVEDDADLTRVRREAEREATGRSVAKGATRVAPRPSAPLNESSSDDEVMPTKKRRGPPKKRN